MNPQTRPHIGAIFIAYNAEHTLEEFYREFPKALFESIVLVDDASKDHTFELAQKLGIESYRNQLNLGYGGNMKRALSIAEERGMDIIIDLHPDGEYDPSSIPQAIEEMNKGAHFVLGNRFTKDTHPLKSGMYFWKVLPILFLNSLARKVLNLKLGDLHQGFRVYSRRLLTEVDYKNNSDGYLFSFEIIAQAVHAGLKIVQVPVKTRYVGKKRGASLKSSILYSLGVFKILLLFLIAKTGMRNRLFKKKAGLPPHEIGNVHDASIQ
ncbi:MAG: glycosyltransferase family 2 protein [Deltaproteobacteria bacterium]|nr:glycosyltransferase family 2 protein [Deltaproteobacteria bacterium]